MIILFSLEKSLNFSFAKFSIFSTFQKFLKLTSNRLKLSCLKSNIKAVDQNF